jgi:hypothetical protein
MNEETAETRIDKISERLGDSEISLRGDFKQDMTMGEEGQAEIKSKRMIWLDLWKVTSDAAASTTMHGLPGIFKAKYLLLKIMWTVFLLVSTGVCAYLHIKSVQDYLEYDVVTVTSTVFERPTLFPVLFSNGRNRCLLSVSRRQF